MPNLKAGHEADACEREHAAERVRMGKSQCGTGCRTGPQADRSSAASSLAAPGGAPPGAAKGGPTERLMRSHPSSRFPGQVPGISHGHQSRQCLARLPSRTKHRGTSRGSGVDLLRVCSRATHRRLWCRPVHRNIAPRAARCGLELCDNADARAARDIMHGLPRHAVTSMAPNPLNYKVW